MKRSLIALAVLFIVLPLRAQEKKDAPPVYGWTHGLTGTLLLSQAGYTDWVAGGENSLSYALLVDGKHILDREGDNWATSYHFGFGEARLGDQGMRKTDDQIKFESIYTYKLGTLINPYASVTMNTQFATGYTYNKDGTSVPVSAFFDPGYLTQGVGLGYQPLPEIKTRLGVALREILTSQYTTYADDPKTTAIETSKTEGGAQLGVEVNWTIDSRMLFTSKLDLFAGVKSLDVVIVHWDNTFNAKLTKVVGVMISTQLINEAPVSPKTQLRETIGLSLSYSLI